MRDVQPARTDLHAAVLERDIRRKVHCLTARRDRDRHVRENVADVAADDEGIAVRLLIKERFGVGDHIVFVQAHGRVRVARDDEIKVPVRDVVHRQLPAAEIRLLEEVQIRRCLIAEVGRGIELAVRIRQGAQRVWRRRGRRLLRGGGRRVRGLRRSAAAGQQQRAEQKGREDRSLFHGSPSFLNQNGMITFRARGHKSAGYPAAAGPAAWRARGPRCRRAWPARSTSI